MTVFMRYRGRDFTDQEMNQIRDLIQQNPQMNRMSLARSVCELFQWKRPGGQLKEMGCRAVMIQMERDGHLKLPAPQKKYVRNSFVRTRSPECDIRDSIDLAVHELGEITLTEVSQKTALHSRLWNEWIDRYHYLGYQKLPGAQTRYLAFAGEIPVACLGFSAAAWKTKPRDQFIGWSQAQREKRLHFVVDNSRFLIFPWVRSKNLASKLLSMASRRLPLDWETRYGYRPVLLETFVDTTRFNGGCYRAANWISLGHTQGRGRYDLKNEYSKPIKSIWVYPLECSFKKRLISE